MNRFRTLDSNLKTGHDIYYNPKKYGVTKKMVEFSEKIDNCFMNERMFLKNVNKRPSEVISTFDISNRYAKEKMTY
jgi:hypothetical protein